MAVSVLSPINEDAPVSRQLAPRLDSLQGARVAVISNGKEGTSRFFNQLALQLRDRFAASDVQILTKGNYSAPAETALMEQVKRWDVVVTGIGD